MEIRKPVVGEIVHVFINKNSTTFDEVEVKLTCNDTPNADGLYPPLPALVVQNFGHLHSNLHVHGMCNDSLVVPMYSVPHKSEVGNFAEPATISYWDYIDTGISCL